MRFLLGSGRELFSNGAVALGQRGLGGMAWVDRAANDEWNNLLFYKNKLTFLSEEFGITPMRMQSHRPNSSTAGEAVWRMAA